MVAGAALVQWSAAIVLPVFPVLGASATSAWRFLFGALILLALTRPNLRHWTRQQWLGAVAMGASTAFMNQCFYQAIARIPLGGAVAIEFLGPFCVAAFGKRHPRHLVFVVLAGLGVVALTRPGSGLSLVGVLFAAGSGLGWALYVLTAARVGGSTRGFEGLAVSMSVAAVVTLPFDLGSLGRLADLQGLRRLPPSIAGVLLAFDPAIAFLIGWLLLSQAVRGWDLLGVACIVVAGAAVTYGSSVGEAELAQ
jgi:inner membrane transporter RhtA